MMDPTLVDPHERAWQEILKLHPPTPPVRGRARQRADVALQDTHPGLYVAYLDNWTGDELERVVVASAAEISDVYAALTQLPPDARARVATTFVPDPNGPIFAGGSGLV